MPSRGKQAAAAAAARSNSNMKTFYWVLGLIAVAGLAVIAWTVLRPGRAASKPVEVSAEALKDPKLLVAKAKPISFGPDNAPIRILAFSDFTCPACRQFATLVEPKMRTEFIEPGKVQLQYYDFPLSTNETGQHKWGFLAARASRCANDQGKFWEFHDVLFTRQNDWAFGTGSPAAAFEEYATQLKMDPKAFHACVNSDKYADVVSANRALGEQLAVGSTPTLFMNQKQLGDEWGDYEKMKKTLLGELGPAAAATVPGPAPASTTHQ